MCRQNDLWKNDKNIDGGNKYSSEAWKAESLELPLNVKEQIKFLDVQGFVTMANTSWYY